MRNIVALVDLDDAGSWRKVLRAAIDNARQTGARLHVLNVLLDSEFKMTIVAQLIPVHHERRAADDAMQRRASVIGEYATADIQLEPVVRLGNPYKEALDFARDVDADLILVGAHRPDLTDYHLGPIARTIVNRAMCSVLVVRE